MLANHKNMMILAGELRVPISSDSCGIIEALYGKPVIRVPMGTDGISGGEPYDAFDPCGIFQPTCNQRISAVATLTDFIGSPYLDSLFIHVLSKKKIPINTNLPKCNFQYIFKVYHNQYADNPIDTKVFKAWPQFVPNLEKGEMEWINK